MAELIDKAQLAPRTEVELFNDGKLLFTASEEDPFLPTFIELDTKGATLLFDFLLKHQEIEPALAVAQQQAAHDIPYVTVGDARPFQYHYKSGRLYVEVDLKHWDPDQGAAIALYRVWRLPDGSLAAFKVDIRESEG